ncbi:hypothetical protein [Desulfospira joergensenii]|uniref:hypothetical protein n=1 Tax=Desulfospira joergensenii TaxID=53329 RepID=UPI0003B5398C|nr:hypothetical protein [Desulfospira joergensenii]
MNHFLIRTNLPRLFTQPVTFLPARYLILLICLVLLGGCAASGPKFITLAYTDSPRATAQGTLALARFIDQRGQTPASEIGHRVLNDDSREVFLVRGTDLAQALTDQTRIYLERKGLKVYPAPAWSPDLKGLAGTEAPVDTLLTARINTFDLRAEKSGVVTKMVLDLDITFFLGKKTAKELETIPVALTLERTEVHFTREKVEGFYNKTLAEVLAKALPFD